MYQTSSGYIAVSYRLEQEEIAQEDPIYYRTGVINQVSQGIKSIMVRQTKIPKIGIGGAAGTLNGRSSFGSVFGKIKILAKAREFIANNLLYPE